jgi:hypothetical protein
MTPTERPYKGSMVDHLGIEEVRWAEIMKKYKPILDSMFAKGGKNNSDFVNDVHKDKALKSIEKLAVVYWAARNQGAEIAKLEIAGHIIGKELVKSS